MEKTADGLTGGKSHLSSLYARLQTLPQYILETDVTALPRFKAYGVGVSRLVFAIGRDLTEEHLTLRAMSLVYTTLLSMVPLLALSFSVLKGFGVHNQIEPLLLGFLQPLGDRGAEVAANIIRFVENMRVGVLGFLGLAMLLYTVISLVQKIESAFNAIWHIAHLRSLSERFRDYLSVILIGPLLIVSAVGITASVMSSALVQRLMLIEPFGTAIVLIGKLVPYVLVIGAFAFVYLFVPNTRVRVGPGVVGALVAGILWQTTGWAFAAFVASSTNYSAIYSSFAILIIFLIWLYLGWLILLVGANVAFYIQYPQYTVLQSKRLSLSSRVREKLTLLVMFLVGQHHQTGDTPWTRDELADRIGAPAEAIDWVLEALRDHKLLAQTSDDPPAYVPGRATECIHIKELVDVARAAGEDASLNPQHLQSEATVNHLLERIDGTMAGILETITLRELVVKPGQDASAVGWPAKPRVDRELGSHV